MRSLLLLLSLGTLTCLGAAWITCTTLIYRLRDRFPEVHAKVGSPNVLSRKVDFLWALKSYESEIGPELRKLKRMTLIYVGLLISLALVSVTVAIGGILLSN